MSEKQAGTGPLLSNHYRQRLCVSSLKSNNVKKNTKIKPEIKNEFFIFS